MLGASASPAWRGEEGRESGTSTFCLILSYAESGWSPFTSALEPSPSTSAQPYHGADEERVLSMDRTTERRCPRRCWTTQSLLRVAPPPSA